MKSSGFGKAMWSAIISRSLTKNMIYDHSRSWSPKSQKYDLKSIMIVIWSEMIGDHDDLDLALSFFDGIPQIMDFVVGVWHFSGGFFYLTELMMTPAHKRREGSFVVKITNCIQMQPLLDSSMFFGDCIPNRPLHSSGHRQYIRWIGEGDRGRAEIGVIKVCID